MRLGRGYGKAWVFSLDSLGNEKPLKAAGRGTLVSLAAPPAAPLAMLVC